MNLNLLSCCLSVCLSCALPRHFVFILRNDGIIGYQPFEGCEGRAFHRVDAHFGSCQLPEALRKVGTECTTFDVMFMSCLVLSCHAISCLPSNGHAILSASIGVQSSCAWGMRGTAVVDRTASFWPGLLFACLLSLVLPLHRQAAIFSMRYMP